MIKIPLSSKLAVALSVSIFGGRTQVLEKLPQ